MSEWQPARIASHEHLKRFHTIREPGAVSRYAGKTIRVRPNEDASVLGPSHHLELGCDAKLFIEVHPDDAAELWPEGKGTRTALCEHQIQTD